MNKKAMLDDAFDLLFMVLVTVLGFFLVYGMLTYSTSSLQKSLLHYSASIPDILDETSKLRIQQSDMAFPEQYAPLPEDKLSREYAAPSPTASVRSLIKSESQKLFSLEKALSLAERQQREEQREGEES